MAEEEAAGRSERWLRRERRRKAERARIAKHGAGLRRVYLDAVRKRIRSKKGR